MDFRHLARALTGKELKDVTAEDQERVRQAYAALDVSERMVLSYRFGLSAHLMTLEEAGRLLGKTRRQTKQLEGKALRLIRRNFNQPRP